jgi:hypothetical protein
VIYSCKETNSKLYLYDEARKGEGGSAAKEFEK